MGFVDRLLGRKRVGSKNIAKERLRLVLIHDRTDISPAMLQALKADLIAVISEHLEIDRAGIEISLTETKGHSRLLATIPIMGKRAGN
jgi:cell division topological specificity factor